MYLCAHLSPEGRVLSICEYGTIPVDCIQVSKIPLTSDGAADDPRRYKWDSFNEAYILVAEWSKEVDKEIENVSKLENEYKYKSFLNIIALISAITITFELVLFVYSDMTSFKERIWLAGASGAILFLIILAALFIGNDRTYITPKVDKLIARINRGKAVTYVFFAFLLSNALYIIQDGGATNSIITEILLIDTSFGFFFAEKKKIKFLVVLCCMFAYFICSTIHFDNATRIYSLHQLVEFLPHLFMFLFIACISYIIESHYLGKGK